MSCLSRLLGFLFALIFGLGLLALSLLMVGRWPELGLPKGMLYSLLCAITGVVSFYLGLALVFARNRTEPQMSPVSTTNPPATSETASSPFAHQPLQAATLEEIHAPMTRSIFENAEDANSSTGSSSLDSPEARILQVGRTRPGWQGNAPQLAQLTNLSLGVADATARSMAQNGAGLHIKTNESGETIYAFDPINDTA